MSFRLLYSVLPFFVGLLLFDRQAALGASAPIRFAGRPVELTISEVSQYTIRIQLSPLDEQGHPLPAKPSVALVPFETKERMRVREVDKHSFELGRLILSIQSQPLTISMRRPDGTDVQQLVFEETASTNAAVTFRTTAPVLGLGEGAQQFDRRGALYPMEPSWGGWNRPVLGSVVPSPFLIGTEGWAMFVPMPEGQFDLREGRGRFVPRQDQSQPLDLYLINVEQPAIALSEYDRLTGQPVMPPKWALGYFQSHRTLDGPTEPLTIARTFRDKSLPCDALIYLGTGYCPAGWNTGHGSVQFNPKTFPDPKEALDALHELNFKVVLHVNHAPRDLFGESIRESSDSSRHIGNYWARHRETFALGVDGWWPDDGDELPLEARLIRHRCYFEGPLADRANTRPWSLHRTGYSGAQRYGGWIWSGDIDSRWATLAAQVSVGLNHSLSLTPFWGSDTGGFYPMPELTGELYLRWFQFSTFCASFRSHGRTWKLHLPWGWNTGEFGPIEHNSGPDESELHNAAVEPITRKYLELRYRLLPYNYALAREARDSGLPMMRALWLHYPEDKEAVQLGHEYLWGRDLLVAPVVEKGATTRRLYLPAGKWHDWWTGDIVEGKRWLERQVDLATLPLYARAGSIIPLDPVRQYTSQPVNEPTVLRVFPGANALFTLYDDDGQSLAYAEHSDPKEVWIRCRWDDAARVLTVEPDERMKQWPGGVRQFMIEVAGSADKPETIEFAGQRIERRLAAKAPADADRIAVSIHIDAAQPGPELKPIWRFFGCDEPNYVEMPNGRKLIGELGELRSKEVFFRTHNLLCSGDGTPALKWGSTGVYHEDAQGNPVYDWTILDRIFDTYLQTGARPYAQIGFMPKDLSIKPEPYQHQWNPSLRYEEIFTGWAYPPKDYNKWAELVFEWVKHCLARYGRAELQSWYWEVWNEPNIPYWKGTPEEFLKLHDFAIDAVRRALPTAKVGGADTAGSGGQFTRTFLEHCLRGTNYATGRIGTPLDFVSFHAKGSPIYTQDHVRMGIANHLRTIEDGFRIVASYPELTNTPIVIGESDPEGCAACQGPQLAYRNGTMYSSYTAASFARIYELAEKHGVNLEGALTWAFEFENQPYFAGFRSLASNGIDKPVLNVFRMFAKMSGRKIPAESTGALALQEIKSNGVRTRPDISALASLDSDKLCILLWHYHDDDLPGPTADVELSLTRVKSGPARLEHFRIDQEHSNAFSLWQQLGSPQQPTPEQYAQLEQAGRLAMLTPPKSVEVIDGAVTLRLDLPRQAVSLLILNWR